MATSTFFYKLRVDLQKFSSGEQLLDEWTVEAQAAMEAINAGVVQVWKDAADPVVYAVINIEANNQAEAHAAALTMLGSLPMGASGELIVEEARVVFPYQEWAEYLASRNS